PVRTAEGSSGAIRRRPSIAALSPAPFAVMNALAFSGVRPEALAGDPGLGYRVVAGAVGDHRRVIAVEYDEVGPLAWFQRPHPVVQAEHPGRIDRGGADRRQRRESVERSGHGHD